MTQWRMTVSLAIIGLLTVSASAELKMQRVGQVDSAIDTSEIVVYDSDTNRVFSTHGSGVEVFDFGVGSDIAVDGGLANIDLSYLFGGSVDSVSSVAVNSAAGYGVALAIPEDNGGTLGRMVFFDTTDGSILNDTVETGYHPDMVTFDGSRFLVANEGEPMIDPTDPLNPFLVDKPGSISVLDVTGLDKAGIAGLGAGAASTFDFTAPNLGPGVSIAGLRINPDNVGNEHLDMEPEYISVEDGKAYVSLQENNAIAEFDLATNKWSKVIDLGTITQMIDASNKDGGANIDDTMPGLPMPDAIASYMVDGEVYIVSANEGDGRDYLFDEDGPNEKQVYIDEERFGDANIDPATLAALDALYGGAGEAAKDENLGRLKLSLVNGNTDGDDEIEEPTMFGTRSFTIWSVTSETSTYDSGSFFETETLDRMPTIFNSDESDPDEFDDRSDDKGPEPEGVTLGEIDGRTYAFVGLERVGGIMMYDVTDPTDAMFVDYFNSADPNLALANPGAGPEGLAFLEKDGAYFLVVGYEDSDSVEVIQIVPEPTTMALMGVGGLALLRRRMRRG